MRAASLIVGAIITAAGCSPSFTGATDAAAGAGSGSGGVSSGGISSGGDHSAGGGGKAGANGGAGVSGNAEAGSVAAGEGGESGIGGEAGIGGQGGAQSGGGSAAVAGGAGLSGSGGTGGVLGAPSLLSFSPAQTYVNVGATGVTAPTLVVTLSSAAPADTIVTVVSSDPQSLTVKDVTVPSGATSAAVQVSGIAQSANVKLTATLSVSLSAHVRVVGNAEQRGVASISPSNATMLRDGTEPLTVSLDLPAPPGGSEVVLTLDPAGAGALASTLTVPENQLSNVVSYVDGGHASSVTITASLGTSIVTSMLGISSAACSAMNLLISEVQSRGVGGASDEFVELYNPTSSPITLDSSWTLDARSNVASSYSSRWVGSGNVIPAFGHFLIASAGYTRAPAADAALATGITDATSIVLQHANATVDAVCYAFDSVSSAAFGAATGFICEGTPATNPHDNTTATNVDASIERKPGGAAGNCVDTNDNSLDFSAITPSAPQSSASALTP